MDLRIIFSASYLFTTAFSMDNTVHLEPHNPAWAKSFAIERGHISNVLDKGYVKSIEHVGSTSVKGMWAKPVIDILIGMDGDDLTQGDIKALESLGYEYVERSKYCDRYYFKKMGFPVSFNLSITHDHGETWKKMIYFRNYIRENPKARDRYLAIKLEALSKGFTSLPEYSAYKRNTIAELEAESFLYAQQSM